MSKMMRQTPGASRRQIDVKLATLLPSGAKTGPLVSASVPDGPFVELKELVGGYLIVEAPSLAEAVAVARECPGLVRPGSGVEVIEIHGP